MTKAERLARIKIRGRIALDFERRNDSGGYIDLPNGRFRAYDVSHNKLDVSYRRSLGDSVPSTLSICLLGKKVFAIEWINGGPLIKTLFHPGE